MSEFNMGAIRPIAPEDLFVKALAESNRAVVEGIPDFSWDICSVRDKTSRQNRVVFPETVCRRTRMLDKDGLPIYEYDLLRLTRFGESDSYGFIQWSDFYRKYIIRRSLEYSGYCDPEKFSISVCGNIVLSKGDFSKMVHQDEETDKEPSFIDHSYCPSKFRR